MESKPNQRPFHVETEVREDGTEVARVVYDDKPAPKKTKKPSTNKK